MENIYVPHFDSRPTEPFMQKEQQTKHAVAEIGDLDKSTGSIRVRWQHRLSLWKCPEWQEG